MKVLRCGVDLETGEAAARTIAADFWIRQYLKMNGSGARRHGIS